EHNPDPQMRPPQIPAEKREELLETMIAGLTHIYRYFEPHRRALAHIPARMPMRREEPKIGRNEPCPCGSGHKYKHCCMASSPFH
ncbi:SEC-C metal-binding domain-containing protein, partial [Paraburkholderia mimosarum]